MAVVPEGTLGDATDALKAGGPAALPEGLCPTCIGVATGKIPEPRPDVDDCDDCEGSSSHGKLCALCRQDAHELWWPTREEARP